MIRATVRAQTDREVEALLFGLALQGVVQMRARGGHLPRLYDSGVIYAREPRGADVWQSAVELYAHGEGDCEDLSSAFSADHLFAVTRHVQGDLSIRELLMLLARAQFPAVPHVRASAPGMRHATVELLGGAIEDPSRRLGM
jgi:hypothetical protein